MVCSKCGEVNSDNFRFCGMCGTVLDGRLETRRPVGATAPGPSSPALGSFGGSRTVSTTEPLRPITAENAPRTASQPSPSSGSPTVLGLSQPSMDSLREKAFSGLDSFFEPEQPKSGAGRIFLLVALLAALGAAGWWTYTNYLGATEPRKAAAVSEDKPAEESSPKVVPKNAAPESPVVTAQSGQTSSQTPGPDSPAPNSPNSNDQQAASGDTATKTADAESQPAPETKRLTPATTAATTSPVVTRPAKREPVVPSVKAPSPATAAAPDTGDASFHKGEAYLYGRGVPENCDEAVKNLKAASAKSNAKARGAFGTMYATGHCVQRDLPTSYLWFAMALRVDPNNQILEKDLNAIWNQMTPPERQAATRMKE